MKLSEKETSCPVCGELTSFHSSKKGENLRGKFWKICSTCDLWRTLDEQFYWFSPLMSADHSRQGGIEHDEFWRLLKLRAFQ